MFPDDCVSFEYCAETFCSDLMSLAFALARADGEVLTLTTPATRALVNEGEHASECAA